jgi:hypothetical protein
MSIIPDNLKHLIHEPVVIFLCVFFYKQNIILVDDS